MLVPTKLDATATTAHDLQLGLGQPGERLRLAVRRRTDQHVHHRRSGRVGQRRGQRPLQLGHRAHQMALLAEHRHHLLVAHAHRQRGRRCRLRQVAGGAHVVERLLVEAAVDAAVVHDHNDDGEVVADHRFDFHAAEAEGGVALHTDDPLAGVVVAAEEGGGNGKAGTDLWLGEYSGLNINISKP